MFPWLTILRPHHWLKNLIVLLPVLFAQRYGDPGAWASALLAAGAFCLVSSGIYILNDLADREQDRLHPRKRHRPLAAGTISPAGAVIEALVVLAGGVGLCLLLPATAGVLVGAYLLLQLGYNLTLKHHMLTDVICLAVGFVFRAAAGAAAIAAPISPWLIVCTFTLCLFLGFCKRFCELGAILDDTRRDTHRRTLAGYSRELLTHLVSLTAGLAIVSYLLYAINPRTVEQFGTIGHVFTLPVVFYGVTRFAMLSMQGRFSGPTDIVLRDRPILATGLLWILLTLAVIRWGAFLHDHLDPLVH